jgi:hypothetical protein
MATLIVSVTITSFCFKYKMIKYRAKQASVYIYKNSIVV